MVHLKTLQIWNGCTDRMAMSSPVDHQLFTSYKGVKVHVFTFTEHGHEHWTLGSAVVALLRPWCTCAERGRPQCSAVREHPVPEHRTRTSGSGAASNTLLRCPHVSVMYVSVFYAPRHTSERVWQLC